jgi:hypothetical protein
MTVVERGADVGDPDLELADGAHWLETAEM